MGSFIKNNLGSLTVTIIAVLFGSWVLGTAYLATQRTAKLTLSKTSASAQLTSCLLSFPVRKGVSGGGERQNAPQCVGLSAFPLSGQFPLSVTLIAFSQATSTPLKEATFFYGDGEKRTIATSSESATITRQTTTHAFTLPGDYTASVQFVDAAGQTSAVSQYCTVTIKVTP